MTVATPAPETGAPPTPGHQAEYTCAMHPQIVRSEPGACPICGMALEPREVTAAEINPELANMTRRFWISLSFTVPTLSIMVSSLIPGDPLKHLLGSGTLLWLAFGLATPVVLWGGWPFFQRGWASVLNRHLNMFTLVALGTGAAYFYSVAALLFPRFFPASFRDRAGDLVIYFEPASVIITLVLLGQTLELRARSQTSSALKPCWGWRPGRHALFGLTGMKRIFRWIAWSSATSSVSDQAKRCLSTALCSKAPAVSMNRW